MGRFHLVSPALPFTSLGALSVLCVCHFQSRGTLAQSRDQVSTLRTQNCATPSLTQHLPFQKAAAVLPGPAFQKRLCLLITWGPSCGTAGTGSLCGGCRLSQMSSACCAPPPGRPEGISVYFGAVGLSKRLWREGTRHSAQPA